MSSECHSVTFREQFFLFKYLRRLFTLCYFQSYALYVLSCTFVFVCGHDCFFPSCWLLLELRLLTKQIRLFHCQIFILRRRSIPFLVIDLVLSNLRLLPYSRLKIGSFSDRLMFSMKVSDLWRVLTIWIVGEDSIICVRVVVKMIVGDKVSPESPSRLITSH